MSTPNELAEQLLVAYDRATTVEPPSARDPAFDMSAGYAVGRAILARRQARGEALVGRKIGFTNRNIWAQYGVDSPIWAPVYARTLHRARRGHAELPLDATVAPRIEPEIAFGLRGPIPQSDDLLEVLDAVEWAAPAFELVDCHYPDWKFRGADSVADQAFHAALVVGTPRMLPARRREPWVGRLRDCVVTLARANQGIERGRGANALGHPATALAFLARTLAAYPGFPPLGAGEIITTGTLTAAMPVGRGETWSMRFEGIDLSSLTVRFS